MNIGQLGKRTVVSLLGEKRALRLYYAVNRYRHYRQPFPPTSRFETEPRVYDVPGHETFFGYHDVTPFDAAGDRLLAVAVPKSDADSHASVGHFDVDDGTFTRIDSTLTWNYQQGCRLQWHPTHQDRILYHKSLNGSPGTVVYDLAEDRPVAELDSPVFSVSPDGTFGIGFHFEHLGRLRPGYGYENTDRSLSEFNGITDRLFAVDLETGEKTVLVNADDLRGATVTQSPASHHYVNYPLIAPDSETVVFLHRWQKERTDGYETRLLAYDLGTETLTVLEDSNEVSHLAWRSSTQLLATVNRDGLFNTKYSVYDVSTGEQEPLEHVPPIDGHPDYGPTGALLFDTIPDAKGERNLYVCPPNSEELQHLGAIYDPQMGPKRCDLHPRWDQSGHYISFDSKHSGKRTICVLPV